MKKIVIALVTILALAGSYLLGSFNASKTIALPEAAWTGGNDAAEAWRELAASLEAAGARVFDATDDPKERIEGLAYLGGLATAALEMKLAKGSGAEPAFTNWMSDYRKFLGDSPDAIYHTAQLSSKYRYEVTGHRGDAEYLGFMLYGKQLNGWNRAAANLSQEQLQFDESGNFTILLSSAAPEGDSTNWLRLEDDIHMLMVRQYYHDPDSKTKAHFTIRNLDAPAHRVKTSEEVASGIRAAATFFTDTVDGAIALSAMNAENRNSIDPPKGYNADFGGIFYPTFDNEYFGGWYQLEDDEALIVEGAVPDAPYWSVSLQNRWMESLDYKHFQVGLNDQQIKNQDGRYRIVVSSQKPATGNWLDTAGHPEGLLVIRYQLSTDSEKPTMTLVKLDDLE
ncbi:MAG: DUF1214 domain-containing protein [Pseudomonadota bacterium]